MRSQLVRVYLSFLRLAAIPRDWIFCTLHGLGYDSSWRFRGLPLVQRRRGASIAIGRRFEACSSPKWNSIGVFQKVMLKANTHEARIEIGDDVGLSGCAIAASKSIKIGNRVLVGSGALITDSDAHALETEARAHGEPGASAPVVIEDDVFIGARAIILKGVTLGRACVVGAGAVVTKDVPAETIVVGNPAKAKRRPSADYVPVI